MLVVRRVFFYLLCFFYLSFIYFYFSSIELIHEYLRHKKIYLEFGHASMDLVLLFVVSALLGISVVFYSYFKRKKNK